MSAQPNGFDAYDEILARLRNEGVTEWTAIERDFLEATSRFDSTYAQGHKDRGWYQSKARYFNDIVVRLLENASGKPMSTRRKKKSQLFEKLDIDVCHPDDGTPVIGAEVKALGTPPHPGNLMKGRGARSDLHKRIREVAFTSIDFKVAYAPPVPIGSFQKWIDSTSPGYFAFWSMRVHDENDFLSVRTMLVNLRTYCNGVGAILYSARDPATPTEYAVRPVSELSMDKSIREIAQRVA
jgi:hypothetical protein